MFETISDYELFVMIMVDAIWSRNLATTKICWTGICGKNKLYTFSKLDERWSDGNEMRFFFLQRRVKEFSKNGKFVLEALCISNDSTEYCNGNRNGGVPKYCKFSVTVAENMKSLVTDEFRC